MAMTLQEMRSHSEKSLNQGFKTLANINLYSTAESDSLVTQAAAGRQFHVEMSSERSSETTTTALRIRLWEDDYPGWLRAIDLDKVELAVEPTPEPPELSRDSIAAKLPEILNFAITALTVPNEYLWGGTVAPHYDCSGLMQAAFWSEGIWLPRDAYQQEAFLEPLSINQSDLEQQDYSALVPGDLVFFGPPEKATHVGLYLGQGRYLHSSGKDMGRNGIAVDCLSNLPLAPAVSRAYYPLFRGAGRVTRSFRNDPHFPARKP